VGKCGLHCSRTAIAYVADAVAAHPERFAGVFSVDVLQRDAPERIDYWVSKGLTGLRVFIAGHTAAVKDARLDDGRSFPAWEYAGKAGIPVCVQLRAAGLPQLATVLERFPRVRVILDHMARPAMADGPPYAAAASLFSLARYGNLLPAVGRKRSTGLFMKRHRLTKFSLGRQGNGFVATSTGDIQLNAFALQQVGFNSATAIIQIWPNTY